MELGLSNNFLKTICYTAVVVKGKERPKEFCEIRYFYIFYFARFPVTIINLCPSCGGIRAPSTSNSQHSATVISHLGNTNCCTSIVHYSAVRTSTPEYKQKISQCCISTICCYQCPLGAPLHSTVGRTNIEVRAAGHLCAAAHLRAVVCVPPRGVREINMYRTIAISVTRVM